MWAGASLTSKARAQSSYVAQSTCRAGLATCRGFIPQTQDFVRLAQKEGSAEFSDRELDPHGVE
eukprot:4520057-Pyramimonas_sp.AAC.1